MNTNDHQGSESVTASEAPRARRREWIGLAVIALPCLLYSMDLTVLELAVPKLSADLKPTSSQLLWILDIYGFLLAGFLITMGTVGDRIGRRRLLLIGAAAFGAASVLAAFSTSSEMLIATRALLGIAGATLAPSTLALIRNMFLNPAQRTFAIGVWATSFSAGAAIGPLAGGVLLEFFWWGSVFLLAVPVMVFLLMLGPVLLPESRDTEAGRVDLLSAALSLISVLAVIYGLKQIAQEGMEWPPLLSILVGLVLGAVFVRRQRGLAEPLIELRLFRAPAFSASLATFALSILVIASVVLSLGVAPVGTLATDIVVGSAPPERAGAASGISETSAEFGGALGIAILGSIGTAVYRSEVADAFPDGAPPEAAEAARDTLGGAVSVAHQLPGPLAADLLDAAREAFTQGLQLAAVMSAAIVLGMAILTAVLLRHVRPGSEPEAQPEPEPGGALAGGKVLGPAAPALEESCAQ